MAIASIVYFDPFPDDLHRGKSIFDSRSNEQIRPLYLKAISKPTFDNHRPISIKLPSLAYPSS